MCNGGATADRGALAFMKQSPLAIGVSLLVGVLLGVGVARLFGDAPRARTVVPASMSAPPTAAEESSPVAELEPARAPVASAPSGDESHGEPKAPRAPERTAQPSEASPEAVAPGEPVFSAALEAHARAGIELGWGQARTDAVPPETLRDCPAVQKSVLTLPAALG
jgi:hypothetical protein